MGLDIFFSKQKEIGYFRKVNFLVKYFEDLGYTIENLVPISVSKDDIITLRDKCQSVLDNPKQAQEILPTTEGFFFGSTEYNENYFDDVKQVLAYCNKLIPIFYNLKDNESINFSVYY